MMMIPVHIPVLLQEVLDNLVLPPAARVLDLTLGLGGHAAAILATGDRDGLLLLGNGEPHRRGTRMGLLRRRGNVDDERAAVGPCANPAHQPFHHLPPGDEPPVVTLESVVGAVKR